MVSLMTIDEQMNDLIAELDNDESLVLPYDFKSIIIEYYLEKAYTIGKTYANEQLMKSNTLSAERRDQIVKYQQRLHEANTNRKKKDVEQINDLTNELQLAKERIRHLENQLSLAKGEWL